MAAFLGLVVHSLTAGFALGVGALGDERTGFVMFFAIIAHKAVGAFSLATVLRLSSFTIGRSVKLLLTFSVMTPLGAFLAYPLVTELRSASTEIPTGPCGWDVSLSSHHGPSTGILSCERDADRIRGVHVYRSGCDVRTLLAGRLK